MPNIGIGYQLWEPGYTEVKYITIANEGSLALKYRLDVIPTVPAVPGEVNLGDVIDVYFIDGPAASAADFADVQANWTKVGALSGLMDMTDGTATGILLPENGSANYKFATDDQGLCDCGYRSAHAGVRRQRVHEQDRH